MTFIPRANSLVFQHWMAACLAEVTFGIADAIAWGNNTRIQQDYGKREIDMASTLEFAVRKGVKA